MVFNSLTFFVFFLLFFPLYWLINFKLPVKFRNIFTLLASYIFYGWWDWRFLGLIVFSSTLDYFVGISLHDIQNQRTKKLLLFISIGINVGILCFFKYFNFFVDSFNHILSLFSLPTSTSTLQIILPVGISFYVFQSLSYTIDVYKGVLKPTRDVFAFFSIVAFFPQLVAGPIERVRNLLPQFQEKKIFSYVKSVDGLRLVLWGMFKKVVIADNLGMLADALLDVNSSVSGCSTLLGAVFFAFQIYTDFSGYSDMAIGLAKMLGTELMINFKTPYFSSSFSEFWRRWHISLSTWFRDYVYIPLGGNQVGKWKSNMNIFITFLLSGLWHGAKTTFVLWGALHGLALIAEKKFKTKINKHLATLFVFFVVVFLWLPFRAINFTHLKKMISAILHISSYSSAHSLQVIAEFSTVKFMFLSFTFLLFFFLESRLKTQEFYEWIALKTKWARFICYYFLLVSILVLGNFDVKPYFIYFQF